MDGPQVETIISLAAKYELPPNREVQIHQSVQSQEFTATVVQGTCITCKPGFKRLDKAIDWARSQFPDSDITAREVANS